MRTRRSKPYRESVYGVCGHVCNAWPQHARNGKKSVICDYCTRDARRDNPLSNDVWVLIRDGEAIVLRKIPEPRPDKEPERTLPLFPLPGEEDVPF